MADDVDGAREHRAGSRRSGIPTLPVAGVDVPDEVDGWWKLAAVREFREQGPETPVVWTDDDLLVQQAAVDWCRGQSRLLAIGPSLRQGLTRLHLDLIEAFLRGFVDVD